MGSAQRRIGPFNLGGYGVLASIVNGCNLVITQMVIPKMYISKGFEMFPIYFFLSVSLNYMFVYPFFLVDIYLIMVFSI